MAGERVRLKADSHLRARHPELAGAVGVVSSTMEGNGDALLHVRFERPVNLIVLNVLAREFDRVDRLEPRLRAV